MIILIALVIAFVISWIFPRYQCVMEPGDSVLCYDRLKAEVIWKPVRR